eukprot:11766208-Karenia_brevis.AAC.1
MAQEFDIIECKGIKGIYFTCYKGQAAVMMPTHVDDIMWASLPGWESVVPDFLKKFEVKKITQDEFRFCGQEY